MVPTEFSPQVNLPCYVGFQVELVVVRRIVTTVIVLFFLAIDTQVERRKHLGVIDALHCRKLFNARGCHQHVLIVCECLINEIL